MNEKMTDEDFRNMMNGIISTKTNADEIAALEFVREFFANAEFRHAVGETTFAATR